LARGFARRFFHEQLYEQYLIALVTAIGLLVGCNQSVKTASEDFNSLPPAVQKKVRAQAPNAEIASVSEKTEN
jgi:hypothetical protein